MTNTSHTPGPWKVGLYSYHNHRELTAVFADGHRIPIVHTIGGGDYEEADANARLIAAAPALLAALRSLHHSLADGSPIIHAKRNGMLDVVMAALAAATGAV